MKILVSGGNGFIGKVLVRQLREQGHEVRTVGRSAISHKAPLPKIQNEGDVFAKYNVITKHYTVNLSSGALIRRMFNHWEPQVIIHLAANPNGKPDMVAPTVILDDNIKATQNLLHWCPEGTHFLFASSIVVYGDPNQQTELVYDGVEPFTEDDACNPTSLYGITKLASEHLIRAYNNYRGIQYKILRLCATVGPELTHGIIYDFIRKLRENDKLEMLGDCPGSCKPYVHVNDVTSAFSLLINEKRNATLNVCSRWGLTVHEIADIVMDEMRVNKEKVWLGEGANWKGDNKVLSASPDKATHFGWNRQLDSEEAIRQCVRENVNVQAK